MEEKLKKCPDCVEPCQTSWNYCARCGYDLSEIEAEKVVYLFMNYSQKACGKPEDSLVVAKKNNHMFVIAGYAIIKVFESDILGSKPFRTISVYNYSPGHMGDYLEVQNLSYVISPTM